MVQYSSRSANSEGGLKNPS